MKPKPWLLVRKISPRSTRLVRSDDDAASEEDDEPPADRRADQPPAFGRHDIKFKMKFFKL